MLRQAQQFALARGIAAGSLVAADEALAPLDPLLRALAQRRLRRLLRRAELETAMAAPDHLLRLAYLFGAGVAVVTPEDPRAVADAVAALPAPTSVGRKGPWLVGAVCGVALLLGALGVWLGRALRPFAPLETAAGQLLGETLADFTVAASRHDVDKQREAEARLTDADARRALGELGVARLSEVLASMRALQQDAKEQQRVDAFLSSVTGLDRELEAQKLPFFVDAEVRYVPDAQPLPMSYYVQRESRAVAGSERHRVLRLWRLDNIGVAQGLLGFTRPHLPAAIVLLDQVESDLVQFVLPAAAPRGLVELTDEQTRAEAPPWVIELEERASKAVSAHYHSLGGTLADDAMRIGTLLSRRRELSRRWAALLRGQGLELRVPTRLFPYAEFTKQLELRIPRADLEAWNELHDELRQRLQGFEALRDRFVVGVERHEVQHRLDYARGLFPVPPLLCRVLGLENALDAPYGTLAARSRDEASAYLAEVGLPDGSPLLDLVVLAHFMLDRRLLGSPYSYAALQVYASLGSALGHDVDQMLGASISRERFARLAEAVWEHTPAELRAAAHKAYASDFGGDLADARFEAVQQNPAYRPDR